jgi:hypothetical protein
MRINLNNILWRTRGSKWDYRFVLRPTDPQIENFYDLHVDAFSELHPDEAPISVGGVLVTTRGEEVRFVATTFTDMKLKDADDGRSIAHYLIWFPTVSSGAVDFKLPLNWGRQIINAFGNEWINAFSSEDISENDLLESARSSIKNVPLSIADGGTIEFDRRVIEKKNLIVYQPPSKANRTLLLTLTVSALVLAAALYWRARR